MSGDMERARMYRVDGPLDRAEVDVDSKIEVQFNPTTLKVGLANSLKQNERDQTTRASQFIEKSSSNLTVELIFDTSDSYLVPDGESDQEGAQKDLKDTDVRLIVKKIARTFLYSPDVGDEDVEPQRCLFVWGAFAFVGIMESMDETLDFFSSEGMPLRATVSLKLNESRFQYLSTDAADAQQTTPSISNAPSSVDEAVDDVGGGTGDEPPHTAAMYNGVESPRSPGGGALSVPTANAAGNLKASASLNAGAGMSAGIGGSAGISGGFGAGLGAGFSAGAGIGLGGSASLNLGVSAGASVSGGLTGGLSGGINGGFSGGMSGGVGGSLGAGVSANVSAGLSGSTSLSVSPPSFSFGASSSLGTSIPGAFSADFKTPSGLCAGAIVSGSVAMRETNGSSASFSSNSGTGKLTASASATAQVGFD